MEFGRQKFTGQNLTLPSRSPVDVYSLHDDGPERFDSELDRLDVTTPHDDATLGPVR